MYLCYLSDTFVSVSRQLPDCIVLVFFVCFLVSNYVFSTI